MTLVELADKVLMNVEASRQEGFPGLADIMEGLEAAKKIGYRMAMEDAIRLARNVCGEEVQAVNGDQPALVGSKIAEVLERKRRECR